MKNPAPAALLLVLATCKTEGPMDTLPAPPPPPTWDLGASAIDCPDGTNAPLLDQALDDAGLSLDQLGYDEDVWQGASYRSVLDDDFLLPWYRDTHWDPLAAVCFANQVSVDLDHALTTDHPVATALTEAMERLGVKRSLEPVDPATAGQDVVDLTALPTDLAAALTPILHALQEADAARDAVASEAPTTRESLVEFGHGGVLIDFESAPDLTDPDQQDWVLGKKGPKSLYDPARVLAFAVEHADLERFAGQDITFEASTDLGKIRIAGPGDDQPGDIGPVALYLDLGGNDTYTHPAGANQVRTSAAVHIDLGGDDTYTYETDEDGTDALLPADADGRYGGDAYYGPVSLSRVGRQGSGRFGIGLLFDLGGGDDHYQSLRASQGWGHLGVGVLFDDGGDDTYLAEAGVQGAASNGIGLMIDAGPGADTHRAFANAQGFAYLRAVGAAYDGGGNDTWYSDPGDPEVGGTAVYYTPQLPGSGNSSFTQGAGFGMRNDSAGTYLSGGLGILRDAGGDDSYIASVFAQGTGYWQGTGLLLDGEGQDTYEALWYVQGGAAHYAIGALLDGGEGDDQFNPTFRPRNVHVGSGHDYSVGILVNEAGDDTYHFTTLAAGASNCQGIGLFVDNDGADTYLADSDYGVGLGNHSGECEDDSRTVGHSIGLFLDSGGDPDTWTWPDGADHPAPADDSSFGFEEHATPDEHGGAIDGDGETAVHVQGPVAR